MVRRLGLGKTNHLTYASLALNPRHDLAKRPVMPTEGLILQKIPKTFFSCNVTPADGFCWNQVACSCWIIFCLCFAGWGLERFGICNRIPQQGKYLLKSNTRAIIPATHMMWFVDNAGPDQLWFVDNAGPDQPALMRRLIWACVVHLQNQWIL